jgi:hypothetical protein
MVRERKSMYHAAMESVTRMPWEMLAAAGGDGEGKWYHGDPQVDSFIVEKPVRKRALGTHHVWVFGRSHALLVFF